MSLLTGISPVWLTHEPFPYSLSNTTNTFCFMCLVTCFSCHVAFEIGVSKDVILSCLKGNAQLPRFSGIQAIVLYPCPTVTELFEDA